MNCSKELSEQFFSKELIYVNNSFDRNCVSLKEFCFSKESSILLFLGKKSSKQNCSIYGNKTFLKYPSSDQKNYSNTSVLVKRTVKQFSRSELIWNYPMSILSPRQLQITGVHRFSLTINRCSWVLAVLYRCCQILFSLSYWRHPQRDIQKKYS